ncbi:IS256 family transposase [Romboutsia lituseburensis]|uniref:IS256 family transposase n=1 Tax=Romboutsia lituseburensis TaxID=1537 RepID=UPI00215A2D97|nr:IS256 family transposase [Romboutsia lituseburensis]MCR8744163.1 IS256 family transposase [Romboutsia lituseburensis]
MLNKSEILKRLIEEYNVKTTKDVQEMLKDLFAGTIQEMLEAELDDHLGYDRYDNKNKSIANSRNGYRQKKVKSDFGEVQISIPRDRNGDFEPRVVRNYENDISGIEDQIIGMYSKGMSTRDISSHLKCIYGIDVSHTLVSKITDRVLPLAQEWQNRALDTIYPIVFMDAIHYKVRSEGRIINKAAYIAIGINLEGVKDVLGIWVGENESSKYWLKVLTDIKNRGVKDILIASVDGLVGFKDAIQAVFPSTEVQRCIVHQIRNTLNYVSYKHRKEFARDLKLVYTASTEDVALNELTLVEQKWDKQYAIALRSWRNNWDELSTYFKYPQEIRTLIYTTNSMESYNRLLRKVTKSKSVFPSDDALHKSLYLATMDISEKWTQKIRSWTQILAHLSIYFEDRITSINI